MESSTQQARHNYQATTKNEEQEQTTIAKKEKAPSDAENRF